MIKLLFLDYTSLPLAGEIIAVSEFVEWLPTFWRLAQWRISEHKTVNTPQKLMRGRKFN
jgi:hypothetical protein